MGMYSSDDMYSTDCDSSEEEDDTEYYDSSNDECFCSLSLVTQIPLESMTFSRLGNPITHLVIYGGFSIPGPAFPCFQIIGPSSNSRRYSHTHKKIIGRCSTTNYNELVYFFSFLVIFRCQIHASFNYLFIIILF